MGLQTFYQDNTCNVISLLINSAHTSINKQQKTASLSGYVSASLWKSLEESDPSH